MCIVNSFQGEAAGMPTRPPNKTDDGKVKQIQQALTRYAKADAAG